jgi:hypothetical protein
MTMTAAEVKDALRLRYKLAEAEDELRAAGRLA